MLLLAGCARNTRVGRLDDGLDPAPKLGWSLFGMKSDWRVASPYELARH